MSAAATFPCLLQAFFVQRLLEQQRASPQTIASYRDTFRLLLQYSYKRLRKRPSNLELADFDARLICDFLNELESGRGNGARTRNQRLAAIHSFFRYVSFQEPSFADQIQRILAIPSKRWERRLVAFLTREEVDALLAAPDLDTRIGRRDRALLIVALRTGLRVSELTGLRCEDIVLGTGSHVRCRGKGRKQRCVPLGKEVSNVLQGWLREREGSPDAPAFPNARGGTLSRDGVEYLLRKYTALAAHKCPSLKKKRVSPHVMRHTTAVHLLQAGVDHAVIALWLGHERVETTQIYADTDLEFKEKVLSKVAPFDAPVKRFRANDRLLAFLSSL